MLGYIDYDHPDGGSTRAVLENDGSWSSPDNKETVRILTALYPCRLGPEFGRPGAAALVAASRFLMGTAHLPHVEAPALPADGARDEIVY